MASAASSSATFCESTSSLAPSSMAPIELHPIIPDHSGTDPRDKSADAVTEIAQKHFEDPARTITRMPPAHLQTRVTYRQVIGSDGRPMDLLEPVAVFRHTPDAEHQSAEAVEVKQQEEESDDESTLFSDLVRSSVLPPRATAPSSTEEAAGMEEIDLQIQEQTDQMPEEAWQDPHEECRIL
jgi:hypothetical protein